VQIAPFKTEKFTYNSKNSVDVISFNETFLLFAFRDNVFGWSSFEDYLLVTQVDQDWTLESALKKYIKSYAHGTLNEMALVIVIHRRSKL
jgi:hypothetical protein